MSYQQNLAQLFWRVLEDPEFLQSIKSHKRYNFRLIAILSNQIGLFFNILAVCLVRNKVLNGLAFLPLCISLFWSIFDLVSNRVFRNGMPLRLIAWVDLLGFVSFLVFLIVNGIVGSHQSDDGISMLLAYTSVPWMFCCVIHGLIVAQFVLPYPFGNLQLNAPVCPDCHRDWKNHGGRSSTRDGEAYVLLQNNEDDIESHAGTGTKITDGETTARTQKPQEDV